MDSELMHYGVKGMKWGVRKDRKTSGSTKSSKKKTVEAKKTSDSDFERLVKKGKQFAKDNAPGLVAAGLSVTAIAVGQSYLVPIFSAGGQIGTLAYKFTR